MAPPWNVQTRLPAQGHFRALVLTPKTIRRGFQMQDRDAVLLGESLHLTAERFPISFITTGERIGWPGERS